MGRKEFYKIHFPIAHGLSRPIRHFHSKVPVAIGECFGNNIGLNSGLDYTHAVCGTCLVAAEQIVDVLTLLRDEYKFELLSALTASDYWPQESPRFHVVYQLSSLEKNICLQVRVPVNGSSPKVPKRSN